ncbi:hypothetical protein [Dysgonomonas sp. GY75]|nr:hypothetical protein [Dysgonomonas sp. GY75]
MKRLLNTRLFCLLKKMEETFDVLQEIPPAYDNSLFVFSTMTQ